MSSTVPFVRVVPEEIGLYGFAGATFVAHIRYRCATAGPDRFEVDGIRWWEVSLTELAAELHVSKDVAQRTMKRLGGAVVAKRLGDPRDQTRAYRVAADDTALNSQNAESHRFDQSERDSTSWRRDVASPPTRNRTGTGAISHSLPLSPELEEGGRSGRADVRAAADATDPATANNEPPTPGPFDYDDDPPPGEPLEPEPATAAPTPTRWWVDGPYGPRCHDPAHRDDPDPPGCGGCKRARKATEAEAEAERIADDGWRDATRKAINKCTECDDYGRLHTDMSDCPRHANFRQVRAS